MKIMYRFSSRGSLITSHLRNAQITMAVKKEDMAYTSDSTAENQKLSVKAYAKAPMMPAPIREMVWPLLTVSVSMWKSCLLNKAIETKAHKIVNPEKSALPTFIQYATRNPS